MKLFFNQIKSLRLKIFLAIITSLLISTPISSIINSNIQKFIDGNFGVLINTIVTLLVSTLILQLFVRLMIINPLNIILQAIQRASQGDLTATIEVHTKDEMGQLSKAFNQMQLNLGELLQQANDTSKRVSTQSKEFKGNAEQNSYAIGQIAESIGEVVSGSEVQVNHAVQLKKAAQHITDEMNKADASIASMNNITIQATEKADQGTEIVTQTVEQMNQTQAAVTEIQQAISTLEEKSKRIGEIVEIITNIAAQTNLLALNAAIEAARAGEHGKGFAVVADEVRVLAEQSAQAAGNIHDLIKEIQSETTNAVEKVDRGRGLFEKGIENVHATGKSFEEIVTNIHTVTSQANEIGILIQETTKSSEDMLQMIEEIVTIAEQNSSSTQNVAASIEEQTASMEEISSRAEALSAMSDELQVSINKFKLSSI